MLKNLGRSWVAAKSHNIADKRWIKVKLSDLSLFLYGDEHIAVINATQTYQSNQFSDVTRKQFYLREEGGHWRIAMERVLRSGAPYTQNLAEND